MKKTLVAIAAIAAMGAASAQVSLSGKLDIGASSTGSAGASVKSGVWETSRVVLKADQDFVGGMKGGVYLEGGIGGDTSTASFSGFGRQAFVSLSGGFGKVDLGAFFTPIDTALWYSDALEYNGFSTMYSAIDTGNNTTQSNSAGAIQYTSPTAGGLTLQVVTTPNGGDVDHQSYGGAGVNYANGPLLINAAFQSYKTATNSTSAGSVIALNYNFGPAMLYGGLTNNDTGLGTKVASTNIGVKVPFGADYVAAAATSTKTTTNGADSTANGYGVNYIKAMNKATVLYVGYKSASSVSTTGAGLRFNF
jgi:predicted porin